MGETRAMLIGEVDLIPAIISLEPFSEVMQFDKIPDSLFDNSHDLIFLSLSLEMYPKEEITAIIARLRSALKDGGELCILTHSLEYAVSALMADDANAMVAYSAIYGSPGRQHLSGYLLNWLRAAVRTSGLAIRRATNIGIMVDHMGERVPSQYNYVVGMKSDDVEPIELSELHMPSKVQ